MKNAYCRIILCILLIITNNVKNSSRNISPEGLVYSTQYNLLISQLYTTIIIK